MHASETAPSRQAGFRVLDRWSATGQGPKRRRSPRRAMACLKNAATIRSCRCRTEDDSRTIDAEISTIRRQEDSMKAGGWEPPPDARQSGLYIAYSGRNL